MSLLSFQKYHERLNEVMVNQFVGSVTRVSGMLIESAGPPVGVGEMCEIVKVTGDESTWAEVVGFRDQKRLLIPLDSVQGIAPGCSVKSRHQALTVPVGPELLGRVLGGLGEPIDGGGPLHCRERRRVEHRLSHPLRRRRITEPLPTGIRAIDAMVACGKGQRMGIFSGSGVGKSTLLGEIAKSSEADVNVVALVGERGREVRTFLEESLGYEGLVRSVVVAAPSDTSPVQRVKAAFVAVTIAEYFRDRGQDVLFLMDSVTRLAQAQREIGLSAGEPPATKGYPPSVFNLLPKLTERLGNGSGERATVADRGSISGILTVLVEADDLADPVADASRSLLDGHIVLSRRLAERGHYPAVDIQASVSRLMDGLVSPEALRAARKLRAICATYADVEDLISIGAYQPGNNAKVDLAIELMGAVAAFLVQPVGAKSSWQETVDRLCAVTERWTYQPDEAGSSESETRGGGSGQGPAGRTRLQGARG